jgi:ribosomal-protein-alanine N-acetyltransferase
VGQTIGYCGLSGPENAPGFTDDEKRSSVPQWQIRAGEAGDLEAIGAIQAASPEAALWPPGDYLQYDVRVAVRGGRVAGFLVTRRTAEGEAEILNLAVAPEFRRRGFARALLCAFLHGFRGDVFLEVRSSNSSARGLYKSLGFQELTLRTNYYGTPPEAAIVMKFHSC